MFWMPSFMGCCSDSGNLEVWKGAGGWLEPAPAGVSYAGQTAHLSDLPQGDSLEMLPLSHPLAPSRPQVAASWKACLEGSMTDWPCLQGGPSVLAAGVPLGYAFPL